MGLKINEITRVEIEASDGQLLEEGDTIMLRVNRRTQEDIACKFSRLSGGYFVTTTLDGQYENKYRQASIETCYHIKDINIPPRVLKEAGEDAAEGAAAPLLAPGA